MLHAIIMAGGQGTRFWPLSHRACAKQFVKLVDHRSFLELTLDRISHLVPHSHQWIVSSEGQKHWVEAQKGLVSASHILYEPCGKNTAACIAWAALEVLAHNPEAMMIVLPADHLILDSEAFCKALQQAISVAGHQDKVVTIGIQPTEPHTGYGYIEALNLETLESPVVSFHEKPDRATALAYLSAGNYFWNSGIFIFKASKILSLFETHLPELYHALRSRGAEAYPELESISFDYGIMEKIASETWVVRGNFAWSDVGSWQALDGILPKDDFENSSNTPVIAIESTGNIIHTKKRLVSLVGVHDLIIAERDDVLLIASKQRDQDIKQLVNQLPEEYL